MPDVEELLGRARRQPVTRDRTGRHDVFTQSLSVAGNAMYTVHHVGADDVVTVLQADRGTFRADLAEALLDAAVATPSGTGMTLAPIGFPLDCAAITPVGEASLFSRVPEVRAREVFALHRSEVFDGEPARQAEFALDRVLGGIARVWDREPVPRAEIRLLDPWPGGPYRQLRNRTITRRGYDLLARELPGLPAGVRLMIRTAHGHELTVRRAWDRLTGELTGPDQAPAVPLDLPVTSLRSTLGPLFLGDGTPALTVAGTPVTDMLEMTYQTRDRGYARLPGLRPLDECIARLSSQLLRHAGNWASFAGRSGAIVQVSRAGDEPVLWLESPGPATGTARGRQVTLDEAARMLTILAREDRSAVDELGNLETVHR